MTDLASVSREALAAKLDRVAHWMRHEDYTLDSNATERDLQEAAHRLRATCRWERAYVTRWNTGCRRLGVERTNRYAYCPYCGSALVEAREETPDEA